MTLEKVHRVLIVSGRLLVAQGLMSLLETLPEILHVEVAESLYDAILTARREMPDVLVIDLPPGAELFVDRPIEINGHEIKTIILQDGEDDGQGRMYVHKPGTKANLQNLVAAILDGEPSTSMRVGRGKESEAG